jgi:hypothetical protein
VHQCSESSAVLLSRPKKVHLFCVFLKKGGNERCILATNPIKINTLTGMNLIDKRKE